VIIVRDFEGVHLFSSVFIRRRTALIERLAYTPLEACEVLRVGRTKLYELIGAQKLKAVALGGKTLIPRADIERFLSELPSIQVRTERKVRNVAP
jgi:excisionase family DNA binding protein